MLFSFDIWRNFTQCDEAMSDASNTDVPRRVYVRRDIIEHRYHISSRTLDTWMARRKIPFIKIGGKLFFEVPKCDASLRRFEVKARE